MTLASDSCILTFKCVLKTCECSLSSGDTLSLHEVPNRSSILVCSSWVGRSIRSNTFVISGTAARQIASRITKTDTQVRTILGDACYPISGSDSTSFHLSQQTVTPHVLSPVPCSNFLKPSLYHRHCAAKSSNESASSSQTANQSVNFDNATVVMLRCQCRCHWVSFKCPCI